MTETLIIIALIVLNGVFAMSEAAVIASRKARLQQEADNGNRRARAAIKLVDDPNRLLSTVQIGITLIGILAGVFGGATVAGAVAVELQKLEFLAPYADALSYGLVVLMTTYLSLIIGELVPKRLALRSPEAIAKTIAIPMRTLSKIASPAVSVLGVSTEAVLWLLNARKDIEPPVTAEEITAMVQQGVEAGVFEGQEHEMVEGIFRLNDQRARAIMTPRTEVVWLNVEDDDAENIRKITESEMARLPVAEGTLDRVIGVVAARDLFVRAIQGESFDLRAVMKEPLFVPESMYASRVMQIFKENGREMAVVLGEHGEVDGIVTLQDLMHEIMGGGEAESGESAAVQRDDGTWLLDGMMGVDDLITTLDIRDPLPGAHSEYESLGGFIMKQLERIPQPADQFDWTRFRFEVMDMDGNRVDKVLVTVLAPPPMDEDEEQIEEAKAEAEAAEEAGE